MPLTCAFCGFESITGCPILLQAKREENFPSWGHLLVILCAFVQTAIHYSISRICSSQFIRIGGHSLFQRKGRGEVTMAPWFENPYYRLRYCYPHDDSLERVLRDYILKNCNTEFRLKWATFDLEMTYLKNSLVAQGLWDQHNDKPVEQYIWYEMKHGPQRPIYIRVMIRMTTISEMSSQINHTIFSSN